MPEPHTILFSGHLIDTELRQPPRFPSSKAPAVGMAIEQALQGILRSAGTSGVHGIAAAACGGDIVFHETCRTLGIPSGIYLGIPVDAFLQTSVAFAGQSWITRYQQLIRDLPVHILLPNATAAGDELWEKANKWMLDTALAETGTNTTLLTLWDGQTKKPGGPGQMIEMARRQQVAISVIDILKL